MFGSKKINHENYILQVGTGGVILGASVISSVLGSNASQSAASTQANASVQAAGMQQATTEQQLAQQQAMYNQNVARMQPWVNQGTAANATLADLLGTSGNTSASGYGSLVGQPTLAQLQTQMAPNYQFMLNQGEQALQSSAAASGGLLTGQGLKDINNYAQNTAQSGLQQAYNNYVTNQTNTYNRLSGLSSLGQNSAAGVGNQGVQTGSNIANTAMAGTSAVNNYLTGGAAATAAGAIGSANAVTGSLNSGLNNYLTLNYLNGLNGGGVQSQASNTYNQPSVVNSAPAASGNFFPAGYISNSNSQSAVPLYQ